MVLNIGERIREKRRERALTQEDVARRLNVSAQAVSKWENASSYPDLELIPPLAELLGVSIDALFREDIESEAEAVCRRADELLKEPGSAREYLPTLREAVIRHPFHVGLLRRLGTVLYLTWLMPEGVPKSDADDASGKARLATGDDGLLREAIAVYERALSCPASQDEHDTIVKNLIVTYSAAGKKENARRLAEQQSKIVSSREVMQLYAEDDGQKNAAAGRALLALLAQTGDTLLYTPPGAYAPADGEAVETHAQRCVAAAELIEAFFPDGRCGALHFELANLYFYAASVYASLGAFDRADACVDKMTRHERENKAFGAAQGYRYGAALFDALGEVSPRESYRGFAVDPSKNTASFAPEYLEHLKSRS